METERVTATLDLELEGSGFDSARGTTRPERRSDKRAWCSAGERADDLDDTHMRELVRGTSQRMHMQVR